MSNEEPLQTFLPHFILNDGQVATMTTPHIPQGRQVYTFNPTSTGQWVLNGVTIQPTTIIREVSHIQQPQQQHHITTDVSQILPDIPLPQAIVQSLVTSSSDANGQKNASALTQGSTGGGKMRVGSNPCVAAVVSTSMKELRLKGTNFLRTHASKHGIPNASRKLTNQVTIELADHYEQVHGIVVSRDDPQERTSSAHHTAVAASTTSRKSGTNKKSFSSSNSVPVTMVAQPHLPQHPLPVGIMQQLKQTDGQHINSHNQQQQRIMSDKEYIIQQQQQQQQQQLQQQQHQQPSDNNQACRAEILVKSRAELSACGTSMLRPEAAAHKVHNSSRKPKDVVVEELWQHYMICHAKDLILTAEDLAGSRWVGSVVDEEEEQQQK